MKNYGWIFVGILMAFTGSCSSTRPVAERDLASANLFGVWFAKESRMEITCDGTFYYSEPDAPKALTLSRRESGGRVANMTDEGFTVQTLVPFRDARYRVTSWPARSDDTLVMTMDGMVWTRDKDFNCDKSTNDPEGEKQAP